jgi:hypothetical protein
MPPGMTIERSCGSTFNRVPLADGHRSILAYASSGLRELSNTGVRTGRVSIDPLTHHFGTRTFLESGPEPAQQLGICVYVSGRDWRGGEK